MATARNNVEFRRFDHDQLTGTYSCKETKQASVECGDSSNWAAARAQRVKYGVLCLLIVQNASTILCMKQASLVKSGDGHQALSTCMVVMVEGVKVVMCMLEIAIRNKGAAGLAWELHRDILSKPRETGGLMLPCLLYFVQNNLLLLAVANLDPPVYYVVSQLKIFATALFSILILGVSISKHKWLALVILVVGVCASQSNTNFSRADNVNLIGVGAATCAVFTSGLAGVLCERALKKRAESSSGHITMTVRNIQLGVPSLLLGLTSVYLQDMDTVSTDGFFRGFTGWTWTVVVLHSLGGLLVTAVMKFADNLLKGLAMAASLVLSCLLSAIFFDFVLSANFAFGACLVLLATFLYLADDNICDEIFSTARTHTSQPLHSPELDDDDAEPD